VSNHQPIYPRLPANLLANLPEEYLGDRPNLEVRGGGHGAPPRASRDCIRPGCSADQVPVLGYQTQTSALDDPIGGGCRSNNRAKPNPLLGGGEIQSREARGESDNPPFPLLVGILPRWPPPNLGARFGRILLPRVLLFSVMTTFYMTTFQTDHCFFFRFVLQRNYFIKRVVLVEASSILLLLRCLEAC
jgi:hypothetical protein